MGKSVQVNIRYPVELYNELVAEAKAAHLPLAAYIKSIVMGRKNTPRKRSLLSRLTKNDT